jgi:hypothetical protein
MSDEVANAAGDFISGAGAGMVSNPANVIAINQKKDGLKFWATAKNLHTQAGPKAFARGIPLLFFRMGFQGVAAGFAIEALDRYQESKRLRK